MTKSLFFIVLTFWTFYSNGQNLIARHTGGSVIFYTSPAAAVSAAVNDDTIYIPAGSYPGFTVNASIVIYGVGYDVDSTQVTGPSFISGAVSVYGSNCRFEGLNLYSGLTVQAGTTNTTIGRCYLGGSLTLNGGSTGTVSYNNILLGVSGGGSHNNYFSNNIIYSQVNNLDYSVFKNNIICYEGTAPIISCEFSEIGNNIFLNNSYSTAVSMTNNVFFNNLFCNLPSNPCVSPYGNTNLCEENLIAEDEFSLFFEYTEELLQVNYYQNNFHAAAGSVIINAGSDGTDLGIYGGAFPWKDGGLPQNPHVFFKSIPPVSDDNGMLDVDVKVNAQDN